MQWHLINSESKHLTFRNLVGVHEAQNNRLIQPVPPVFTWRWGHGPSIQKVLMENLLQVRHTLGPADQQGPLWSVRYSDKKSGV